MSSTNIYMLLLDVFVHGQGWIPSVSIPSYEGTQPISISYNGNEYTLTNPSIIRWLGPTNDIPIVIPDSIFYDVIGDYPELLPTASEDEDGILHVLDNIPLEINSSWCSRMKVLDIIAISLLLNYLGVYDLAWKLQGLIYTLREYLPDHWRDIGGVSLNKYDEKLRKWNGDPSPFMKSQFNGMYIPFGIYTSNYGYSIAQRFMLNEDIIHHSEMYILVSSPVIQQLSFGMIPKEPIHIDSSFLNAIAMIGTNRNIIRDITCKKGYTDITSDISIQDIISILQKDGLDISIIENLLLVVPVERLREATNILIDTQPITSIIQAWDIYCFTCEEKKAKRLSGILLDLLNSSNREEFLEDMTEEGLISIANSLGISIPTEDGDISSSQLIRDIRDKLSLLLRD